MSQETRQRQVLDVEREQYVPDWIVEEVVALALRTQLREPILEAVREADAVETQTVTETDHEETETADGDGGGNGGRVRGLVGLVAVVAGLSLAYWALSKKRE